MQSRISDLFVFIVLLPTMVLGQPDNITWRQVENAIFPFYNAGSAVLGDYMYCFGGVDIQVAQALNFETRIWEQSTMPNYGNSSWCGVATDEHIYLVGCYNSLSYYFGYEFQRFTPATGGPTGTWELMADYPHAICGIAADWDGGNYIYACGGGISGTPITDAYRYSIAEDVWEPIADLPEPMKYHGGAFINGEFHVIGGINSSTDHYAYNPDTESWSIKASLPFAVYIPMNITTSTEYSLFCITNDGSYSPINYSLIYNPFIDSWTIHNGGPWNPYHTGQNVEYIGDGKIIAAGAYYFFTTYNEVYLGEGFQQDIPVPYITPIFSPQNPPIVIPMGGGNFQYFLGAVNSESITMSFDLWTMLTMPDSSLYGPVVCHNVTLNPNQGDSHFIFQLVPGRAPAGTYIYHAYTGEYPDSVYYADEFEFEKLAGD